MVLAAALAMSVVVVAVLALGHRGGQATFVPTAADETMTAAQIEQTAQDVPPPEELPALGIQFHGTWTHYDTAQRDAVLDKIEESGATWVRLDVGWGMLQPTEGQWDMSWAVPLVDEVMAQLRARDLKVEVMFWLTPDWANGGQGPYTPPDDNADFAKALSWVANRWGSTVDAWEIWNEPNLDSFFVGTDPEVYTDLLCASYPAVKKNDPGAPVVFGGLMYADDPWLSEAYDAGVKGCFDVMSVHTYMAPSDAEPSLYDNGQVWTIANLKKVREVMLAHDDAKPMWITEFGWSVHDNAPDDDPWRRGVTAAEQAQYAAEALAIFSNDFPYVQNAFWYKDVVNNDSGDAHLEGFAMLEKDLTPRPVFSMFQRLYGVA